jgi:hypothetical protein
VAPQHDVIHVFIFGCTAPLTHSGGFETSRMQSRAIHETSRNVPSDDTSEVLVRNFANDLFASNLHMVFGFHTTVD